MRSHTKYILAALAMHLCYAGFAQLTYPNLHNLPSTTKRNYVRVFVPEQPTQNATDISLPNQNALNCMVTTQYMDGLGRPMQEVQRTAFQVNSMVQRPDFVKQHTYDAFGRESFQYLPYSQTETTFGNKGKLKATPLTQLTAQYNTLYPGDQPYSQTMYDNSPLNRISKQLAPGQNWVGSNRGVSYYYESNLASDKVISWKIGALATDQPIHSGFFAANQLYIVKTIDEDGHTAIQYTDMKGRVVLKRQVVSISYLSGFPVFNYTETYYVYDDLDMLRYVLSPKAIESLGTGTTLSAAILNGLCFRYFYDNRGRVIEEQVPDKTTEYFVYDNKDRVAFVQDGNLRSANKWQFNCYDVLNRPLESGIYSPATTYTRASLQSAVDAGGVTTPADILYFMTNDLFNTYMVGLVSDADVQVFNFYDDYDHYEFSGSAFDNSFNSQLTGAAPYASLPVATMQTRGLLTANKTKVLDPNNVTDPMYNLAAQPWIRSTNFYDTKERPIQVQKENHCTGTDVLTNQYDFAGNVVSTVLHDRNPLAQGIGAATAALFQTTDVVQKYTFDYSNGRQKGIAQKINADGWQPVNTLTFDALGRVNNKMLNIADNFYSYNVRGWLTGINSDHFNSSATSSYYFCEKLLYNDPNDFSLPSSNRPLTLTTGKRYHNGNIAASLWQGYGNVPVKAYVYTYDNLNRVTDAKFSQRALTVSHTWGDGDVDYTMWNVNYDKNGNIKKMNQKGQSPSSGPVDMDKLTYTYLPNSNQLDNITDAATVATNNPDFKDAPVPSGSSATDYAYDLNGNLTKDNNKKILNIEYSYLNKPTFVDVDSKGKIFYIYDATGNKVQKIVNDNSTGTIVKTTTDYVGGFEYSNNVLKNVGHQEGRCRPVVNTAGALNYTYDYFIKDHVQNVRAVVAAEAYNVKPTNVPASSLEGTGGGSGSSDDNPYEKKYMATHEVPVAPLEDVIFSSIDPVRADKPGSMSAADQKAAQLWGTDPNRRIGTSKMIRVMPGDQFSVAASSFYDGSVSEIGATDKDLLNSLLNTLAGGDKYLGLPLSEIPQSIQLLQGAFYNPSFLSIYDSLFSSGYDSSKPAAFLNYLVMDDEMNILPAKSRTLQITGDPGTWNELGSADGIRINRAGYVLVFVSSTSTSPVSFDHVTLTHYRGHVLEEDHYYPFGLNIEVAAIDPALKNNLKFTSKELQNDEFTSNIGTKSGLELEDYGARMYDPQIGRWNGIDEKADEYVPYSPYIYSINNPVKYLDTDGKGFWDFLIGYAAASADNFTIGLVNTRELLEPTNPVQKSDYYTGALTADVQDVVAGGTEVGAGGTIMTGSVAVTGASGGFSLEVSGPTFLGGLGLSAHGMAMGGRAAYNMSKDASKITTNNGSNGNGSGGNLAKAEAKGSEEATKPPKTPTGKGSVSPGERDPKRLFTKKETEGMLKEQGGKCANCDVPKTSDQVHGHHIKRHADGGSTTTGNGAAVCKDCHIQIHK